MLLDIGYRIGRQRDDDGYFTVDMGGEMVFGGLGIDLHSRGVA